MIKKIFYSIIIIIICISITKAQVINGTIIADTANITIVKVWGTHYERGYAQGFLLSDKIYDLYVNYILSQVGSYMSLAKSMIESDIHIHIDQKYKTEAQGMINGMADAGIDTTGVDYLDILVANSFIDLEGFPGIKLNMGNNCSTLASWNDATYLSPLQGKSVISRHLDWGPDPAIVNNQVVVAHIPSETDEQPWIMVGFAGQISALSAFNNEGLAIFQNMMSDFPGPAAQLYQAYEPIWFTMRKAIEQYDYNNDGYNDCNDIRSAIQSNPQGYADGYIITCLAPSTAIEDSLIALIAEVAPQAPLLTFRTNSYEDSIPNDNLYAANYEIKRNDHRHYCSRYLGVVSGLGQAGDKISKYKNWEIMRDYSNAGSSNIQLMQFVPEDRYFDITVYRNNTAAYLQDSIRIWLDSLFELSVHSSIYVNPHNNLIVQPNPFNQTTTILFDNPQKEIFTLRVIDINGKVVFLDDNVFDNKIIFSAKDFKPGIYYILLNGNKNSIYKTKIIISN